MYIYNITFVTSPDKEIELLNYLRNRIIPTVVVSKYPANNPELRKVIETGGEKPSPEHGVSIAFSAAFPTEEVAHLWHDEILMPALADFHLKFGEQGLFFVTLLENLSL